MDEHFQPAQQQALFERLAARSSGFVPFEILPQQTIPSIFARRASLHPDKHAIVSDGVATTYSDLLQLSRRIDRALRELVPPADRSSAIAILAEKSTSVAAAMLATLRAGGFYVPLDPAFPHERNARILQASGARCVVTDLERESVERHLSQEHIAVHIDEIEDAPEELPDRSQLDSLGYVIFTSGSTGNPKGVMQTQENLLQLVGRYTNGLCIGCEDRVSLLSSCSVTAAVGPLFSSLLNGATVCAFPVARNSLAELADWLDRERVTLYHSVPSLFRHLMETIAPERVLATVEVVRMGGDSVYRSDWELFRQHFSRKAVFVNSYGCSEISSVARFYLNAESQLDEGVVPVGYPMAGVQLFITGADGVAGGVDSSVNCAAPTGEIVLRSDYLSTGYWRDDQATSRVFTPATNASGSRSYKTGDLGAIRRDSGLVHLGRTDAQTKISGFRVEIAEIEACLRRCPQVRDVAVLAQSGSHGERELHAFAVTTDAAPIETELRHHCVAQLPTHMIPTQITIMKELPWTPNGKIDRSALLLIREQAKHHKLRVQPRTPTEESLCELWKHVLGLEEVGVEDNYFELGGNSLLSLKLIAHVAEKFEISLTPLAVFQQPTIGEMALLIDSQRALSEQCNSLNSETLEEGVI